MKGSWSNLVSAVTKKVDNSLQARQLALEAKEAGKVWDANIESWVFYNSTQELEESQQKLEQVGKELNQNTKTGSSSKSVKDTTYYDLLQVAPDCSDNDIRKAYFKQARLCHPDKHPDDPEAHSKFQTLGAAYQVLQNPAKRQNYDLNGVPSEDDANASDAMQDMDPFVFFNVMFGSSLVEPYIGELWIASMSDSVMKQGGETEEGKLNSNGELIDGDNESLLTEEEKLKKQEEELAKMKLLKRQQDLQQAIRQCTIANSLRKRVEAYTSTTNTESIKHAAFVESAQIEAHAIGAGPFGPTYLQTIGFSLEIAAMEYLGEHSETTDIGNMLGGTMARTRKHLSKTNTNWQLLRTGIKAAGAGVRAMQQAEQLKEQAEQQQGDGANKDIDNATAEQAMAETIDGSLPAFLELAWAVNKRDIQATVQASCKKLFDDCSGDSSSNSKAVRLDRARAVKILGAEFMAVGKLLQKEEEKNNATKSLFDAQDIKARVAVATMTTMAKAQGQEVSEEDQAEMIRQAKEHAQYDMQTPVAETTEKAGDQAASSSH